MEILGFHGSLRGTFRPYALGRIDEMDAKFPGEIGGKKGLHVGACKIHHGLCASRFSCQGSASDIPRLSISAYPQTSTA